MKNKLGFALCLLLVAVFMGCKEDEEGKHHFSNQVFISATSFTDDVFIKRDNLDVTREESCDVTVAMAQPRERDITVTFAEAPGLLEHYRMFYDDPTAELLPANGGYYDFADNSTVITAGMVESAPLTFAFTNLDNLPIEEKQRYVLPVRIVSADGMNILESARTVYFVFSKAALINVVAEMENNCAWPEWTADTEAVKDMETFTLEALVYANSFDRGTICVYIDGKLKDTVKASVSGTDGHAVIIDKINFAIPHSDETDGKERCFWIGHSYRLQSDGDLFYERRFDGMMGEVRLWNKALTAEEIASENHFYKIDPASDGLVAYWKFDDNTKGKTVKDYTGNGFDLKTEREVNWQSVALPEE